MFGVLFEPEISISSSAGPDPNKRCSWTCLSGSRRGWAAELQRGSASCLRCSGGLENRAPPLLLLSGLLQQAGAEKRHKDVTNVMCAGNRLSRLRELSRESGSPASLPSATQSRGHYR